MFKRNQKLIIALLTSLTSIASASAWADGFPGGVRDALGPRFNAAPHSPVLSRRAHRTGIDSVRYWNEIAINASGIDHTPVAAGENRVFGEQLGPGRSSRAMAIVHIAIFDAVNAITGGYQSYTGLAPARDGTSMEAAIAQAACDTLIALFPSQSATFDDLLAADLSQIPDGRAKTDGIDLGHRAAAVVLTLRADDGSQYAEPRVGVDFIASNEPGKWRQDPVSLIPLVLGAYWGRVTPFTMKSAEQFRVAPPPTLASAEYAAAFNEVKRLGGDGTSTATERTPEQTEIGIYWAYDGTPSLCAPPRLYNQIAVEIADQMGSNEVELARLLALVNLAMADAGIAIWESKYYYQFWRPVTGIREADEGTGPTGAGDGNPATVGDPAFSPLGAPASNLNGPNFTPPFPAYPSGHAGFRGRALPDPAKILRYRFDFVYVRLRRVQRRDAGQQRQRAAARLAQFLLAVPGGGREWPEPNLPRYSLGLRQDRGNYPGPAGGGLRVRERFRSAAANDTALTVSGQPC